MKPLSHRSICLLLVDTMALFAFISHVAHSCYAQAPPASGRITVETLAAANPNHNFSVWEKEVAAYEEVDKINPPPRKGILFLGSSTIRMWKTLAVDFPEHTVINRGIGGSEIVDSTYYAERIIFPYEPKQIFLRAGGNDIHNGQIPTGVAYDFEEFVQKVRERLPNTEIVYIFVNPAPARWGENDKYQELNRLIRQAALRMPRVCCVDAYDISLDAQGRARDELFLKDKLHFNADGYKSLAERVRPYLLPTK